MQRWGNTFEVTCPSYGHTCELDSVFCDERGHDLSVLSKPSPRDLFLDEELAKIQRCLPKGLTEKILAQRGKIEGERKQVTVLICDMEGFAALSERIGPEEAYSIILLLRYPLFWLLLK